MADRKPKTQQPI